MSKLSLQNAILTFEQLEATPSRKDGIPEELEDALRQLGCEFIQSAGKPGSKFFGASSKMERPQVAMATAQPYYSFQEIGMGALFLASKVQESSCKIRDLINVYHYLIIRYQNMPYKPLEYFGQTFYDMKDSIVIAEMQILKRLGFNVHVQLPYGLMVNYLQVLELTEHKEIPQKAWGYLNDALRTNIYVCYQPPTIACAVIWLAARIYQVKLPTEPPWWSLFEAKLEDILFFQSLPVYHQKKNAGHIMRLYAIELPPNLPLTLEEIKQHINTTQ
ncbi:6491_t:CDS:2 [Ambispora leptoticha]|uniref:6491_t:CDS:1 n=1 Tax=Ambispora leptoticha TaxID=144679 RepID=A0A9N8YLS1_9GLOM|nr:6491_t:CDS:2 [Ambispora leptoticha]